MWAKLRATANVRKDVKELRDARKSLNVNEEYLSALRTKSYSDFFTKAQSLVNQPSFPSFNCHHKFAEVLLEPGQEAIPPILESALLSKMPEIKGLMLNYFDISAEASKICTHLLRKIYQTQSNHQFIQQVLDSTADDCLSPEKVRLITSELNSYVIQSNPFSTPNKHDFKQLRDSYSSVLHHLKSKRKRVARRIKLITYVHKITGIFMTTACCLISATAIVLAAHTLAALVMGPAIFGLPIKGFKKKLMGIKFLRSGFLRSGFLRKVGRQLDVAAKGTYILSRDFDTMSRLVTRLHDEVEHNKEMIHFCLERKYYYLQILNELKKSDGEFRMQVEELEEHVYLCLVTINRARALVLNEVIMRTGSMGEI